MTESAESRCGRRRPSTRSSGGCSSVRVSRTIASPRARCRIHSWPGLQTGEVKWHEQFTEGDVFQLGAGAEVGDDHDVGASPNLFKIGSRKVVGVADKEGTYYTLDRKDGAEVWRTKLTPGGANGGVMASTAYHGGHLCPSKRRIR